MWLHCFELIETVLENSLAGFFSNYRRRFFFSFFNRHHHTYNIQRIDANTDATNNTTKTTPFQHRLPHANTTKHNTHFQHRYRPASFRVARALHSLYQDSCSLHDVNMFGQQGMDRSALTLTLWQVRAVCTQREPTDHSHVTERREKRRERWKREREKERERRDERERKEPPPPPLLSVCRFKTFPCWFKTLPCVPMKRAHVEHIIVLVPFFSIVLQAPLSIPRWYSCSRGCARAEQALQRIPPWVAQGITTFEYAFVFGDLELHGFISPTLRALGSV